MPQFGTLSSTADMPTTGGGTVIGSGTGPPTGNTGDFYMDTSAKVLFGPKVDAGSAVDQYALNPADAPFYPSSGPGNYTWGLKVRFLLATTVTALRYHRSTSSTIGPRTLTLYRAGVSVGSVTSPGETGSGWKTIPLGTPVNVDAGVDYVAAYHTGGDFYAESAGVPSSYSPTLLTVLTGCYVAGTGFPFNDVPNNYFADLVVKTLWPMAIKSA